MKKILLLITLTISISLVFSQGKPCCKNKSGKGKHSCKINPAQIDTKSNSNEITDGSLVVKNAGLQCKSKAGCKGCKCSKSTLPAANQKKCDSCTNVKWWQFWVKKKGCCSTKS